MDATIWALLAAGMLVAAFVYASVGHGGASAYLAAMALAGIAPAEMRPIALTLNILVSALASWKFWRAGHFHWRLFWPFAAVSIPFAYLGGAITPGVSISVAALSNYASKLPRVDLDRPEKAIGRNTVASMQSGIVYGYAGLVEGLVRRLRKELGYPCRVIATGGLARLIAPQTDAIEHVDDDLTLTGLRLIFERNEQAGKTPPPGDVEA